MEFTHSAVLLREAVEGLKVMSGGTYIDLTFGRGGHSAAILGKLGPEGRLIAMDRDSVAIEEAKTRPIFQDNRFSIVHAPFSCLSKTAKSLGCYGKVNGVLMDLGVSSPQLDDAERGFSFMRDGPLDMRMDPSTGISAADWINTAEVEELSAVFKEFGEERFHWRIAKAIVMDRQAQPFTTTLQLAGLISRICPVKEKHKHPATRVFQAIRIHVNDELGELKQVLEQSLDVLAIGGRLCAISFHSLEDRIVKRFIRQQAEEDPFPLGVPVQASQIEHRLKKMGGLVRPSEQEMRINPRARSARMRLAERLK